MAAFAIYFIIYERTNFVSLSVEKNSIAVVRFQVSESLSGFRETIMKISLVPIQKWMRTELTNNFQNFFNEREYKCLKALSFRGKYIWFLQMDQSNLYLTGKMRGGNTSIEEKLEFYSKKARKCLCTHASFYSVFFTT